MIIVKEITKVPFQMAEREWVHLKRRRRVSTVCKEFLKARSDGRRRPAPNLLFSRAHNLVYCPIPKVIM